MATNTKEPLRGFTAKQSDAIRKQAQAEKKRLEKALKEVTKK